MNRRDRIVVGSLIAGCLVLGGVNLYLARELERCGAMDASGESERLRLAIASAQRVLVATRRTPVQPGKASTASTAPSSPESGGTAAQHLYTRDPEYKRLRRILGLAKVFNSPQHAALYKALKLSPEKIAKLEALTKEEVLRQIDIHELATEQNVGTDGNSPGLSKLLGDAIDPIEAEVNAVLGSDGIAARDEYFKNEPYLELTSELQRALSYSATPLTDQQAAQVTALLRQYSPEASKAQETVVVAQMDGPPVSTTVLRGTAYGPETAGNAKTQAAITDSAMNAASGVLSADQLAALKQLQLFQQSELKLGAMLSPGPTTKPHS